MGAKYQATRLASPWISLIATVKTRAKQKGLAFDLTEEWAKSRWTGQCEISALPFVLGQRGNGPKRMSPSIDRIVPSLGYVQTNCRFVLHAVNALKQDGTDEEMLSIAEAIVSAMRGI